MARSNQPVTPTSVIKAAHTRKAPTASAMLKLPASPAVASTAAPGVDQATITGLRSHKDGTSEHSPMPSPSAHTQEVICAGVAWNACAAWNTIATELVKPTSTATKPAVNADRLRSLKNCCMGVDFGSGAQPGRRQAEQADHNCYHLSSCWRNVHLRWRPKRLGIS